MLAAGCVGQGQEEEERELPHVGQQQHQWGHGHQQLVFIASVGSSSLHCLLGISLVSVDVLH